MRFANAGHHKHLLHGSLPEKARSAKCADTDKHEGPDMIRRLPQLLFVVFAALLACQAGAAPIVDVAAVKAAQARGAIVWDVRATPLYRKGHIPCLLYTSPSPRD